MTTGLKTETRVENFLKFATSKLTLALAAGALGGLLLVTGCAGPNADLPTKDSQYAEAITLREGDVVKIIFPGAQNLDSTQPIRRDGKIVLSVLGEIKAAGLTPSELEQEIIKQAGSQLVSKEVTVTIESSAYPVFITGAVVRPGKVMTDHQITALEAIMEAGGFDYAKADLTDVKIIRHQNGEVKNFSVNLKRELDRGSKAPFYLQPSDIVFVKTKFSWL